MAEADAEYAHLPFKYCHTLLCLDLPVYMYQADNEGVHQSALVSVNRKEQVYKVTERILNDYLAHQSGNANIRSAQRVVVGRCLASYYGIYIGYFPNNAVDDERIRRMDEALLKHDTDLYASLNDVYRLKWHFVKRYRATGHTQVRIMRMLEAINNLKKRLIRCGDKL